MSAPTRGATGTDGGRFPALSVDHTPVRLFALAGVVTLLASFLGVLYRISDVAGDVTAFALLAVGALVAATLLARFVRVALALGVALVLVLAGTYVYLGTLPSDFSLGQAFGLFLRDTLELVTGLSVLRIINVGLWAQVATPAPVLFTWYLALRRHYVASVAVGGAMLTFFVLTGDASGALALLGVVGGAGAIGFGDLDRRGGDIAAAETVAVVLAAMVTAALVLSVVPTGGADPLSFGGPGETTVEASLTDAGDSIQILGSIQLSPEVRFSVESDTRSYWRVGSYDRYTGNGWIRTGADRSYGGRADPPPGRTRTVRQRVTVEADAGLTVLPAAWKPVRAEADGDLVRLPGGGLAPDQRLEPGDTYTVESEVVVASAGELRAAGTDYPDAIEDRYTQLPETTPDRVEERTARITANADNPYDTARVIERWLENNREYSLQVDRPRGNIADAFLFEMDAGYCTYFATTMVAMLRSQDIPARLTVGYTPGQQVDGDRWVARGLDSHAWVEAYFPETGWVRFDPTPAQPRRAAERQRIQQARLDNETAVDNDDTRDEGVTATATPTPTTPGTSDPDPGSTPTTPTPTPTTPNGTVNGTAPRGVQDITSDGSGASDGSDGAGGGLPRPTREQTALGLVVLAGVAAGVHRSGAGPWLYREIWLRYQPRSDDPAADVERAFGRLEYLAEKADAGRDPGETVREFARSVRAGEGAGAASDERAARLAELYERARYGGGVTDAEADEAVALADELVAEQPRIR